MARALLLAVLIAAIAVVAFTVGPAFWAVRTLELHHIQGSTELADAVKLPVRKRTVLGKKTESLRRAGILPAVVFGGHEVSVPVETDAHAFDLGYRRWGSTTLLSLEGIGADGTPALIAGVARDPVSGRILHIDFERVSLTERTHADVPLHFVGTAGAVKAGAVLVHAIDHVRVEALPQDIPHSIDVDLSKLETVDDAVHVRDLIVDTTKVRLLKTPEDLVVKAVHLRVEEVAPTPAAVPAEGVAPAEGAALPAEGEAPAGQPAAGASPAGTKAPAAPAAPGRGAAAPAAATKGAPASAAGGAKTEKR